MKVFIGTSSFASFNKEPLRMLEDRGVQYELNPYGKTLTEDQIFQKIEDLDGLIAGLEPLGKKVLGIFMSLKIAARIS